MQAVNRQLHEAMMDTRDKLMVNGDTETGTTNMNSDGTAPGTGLQTPYYIASDGFKKVGLTNGRDAQDGRTPVMPVNDYYDSTLMLLANVAASENN